MNTSHQKFHLGFFMKFGPPAWQAATDRFSGSDWPTGTFFVDLAQKLERAKFDFVLFEDTSTVTDKYGGSMALDLKHAIYAPKHDPLPLLPVMAHGTEHIGLIGTASTTLYPPFLLARLFSTLDSLTSGRVGWNIVTSSETNTAKNYGLDALPSHETRYAMADEFVTLATALWDAWEEGSLVMNAETGTYVDAEKVHHIDFEGKFFRSRGPLNTLRSPQGRPVLSQAGGSPRGRDFAAKYSEVIVTTTAGGVEGMKAMREDIRKRMESYGRNPDDCKLMYIVAPIFTDGSSMGKVSDEITEEQFEHLLVKVSSVMDIDLSQYDLDAPVDQSMVANGHTSILADIKKLGEQGKTLRQALIAQAFGEGELDLVGTPQQIAEKMIAAMDEVGGGGFLIEGADISNPTYLSKLTDELIPALQAAGAVRTEYSGKTFRENLQAF